MLECSATGFICECSHYMAWHTGTGRCKGAECSCRAGYYKPRIHVYPSKRTNVVHKLMPMRPRLLWQLKLHKSTVGRSTIYSILNNINTLTPIGGPSFKVGMSIMGYKLVGIIKNQGDIFFMMIRERNIGI